MSLYEKRELEIQQLKEEIERVKGDLQAAEEIIEEYSKK